MVNSIGAYFAMGGYAVYVWPAYGIATAVLGGLALYAWQRYRDSVRSLERLQRQLGPRR
ncbi:MAG TPA: heme exporter protein CcmD [Stellaceae bacterium]|nr:heme exporter protein CcmD [Stellaceae bacterium]